MRKLYVFDTTLRDGEQSLGITLNVREKLEIGRQLVKLGVDIIEAGFPASSPGDMESVRTMAKEIKGVTICGLTRAVEQDIDLCAEALRKAESPRIHTGIGVSPVHMERKLKLTPDQVVERAVSAVKYAKKYVSDVEFYAEDAFRSDPLFLARVMEEVIHAGATVVNIPDTVGYANPWEFGKLVDFIINNVKNIDKAIVSVHCHNDLGMATANSLAGIK
ncbi:MAG: 2-isopropylmalate synthase, partial [Desulfitobacterium hafniense]|nr:2-isopropylmalate synthase [Desulfitobacterium hafniense]